MKILIDKYMHKFESFCTVPRYFCKIILKMRFIRNIHNFVDIEKDFNQTQEAQAK